MLVLKHMNINGKLAQLQCTFPKLTEVNQHYVLGLAEGLKRAQKGRFPNSQKEVKTDAVKLLDEYV
jgi:hypothetical protein